MRNVWTLEVFCIFKRIFNIICHNTFSLYYGIWIEGDVKSPKKMVLSFDQSTEFDKVPSILWDCWPFIVVANN